MLLPSYYLPPLPVLCWVTCQSRVRFMGFSRALRWHIPASFLPIVGAQLRLPPSIISERNEENVRVLMKVPIWVC